VINQLSDRQRADAQQLPTCATMQYPGRSIYNPLARALLCALCMFPQTSSTTQSTSTKLTSTKPFACAYLFLACARHTPTCACPSCAHARHLPARALSMPARTFCLRAFACLLSLHTVDVAILLRSDIALARVFTGAPMAPCEHRAKLATVSNREGNSPLSTVLMTLGRSSGRTAAPHAARPVFFSSPDDQTQTPLFACILLLSTCTMLYLTSACFILSS